MINEYKNLTYQNMYFMRMRIVRIMFKSNNGLFIKMYFVKLIKVIFYSTLKKNLKFYSHMQH